MENNGIEDGFHWEEWRGGKLVSYGWHNGGVPSGKDATDSTCTDVRNLPESQFDRVYKEEK